MNKSQLPSADNQSAPVQDGSQSHRARTLADECSRLSAKALLHRVAAKNGLPFEFDGHTYKGDSAWHTQCAGTLERAAANLNRELARLCPAPTEPDYCQCGWPLLSDGTCSDAECPKGWEPA